MTHGNSFELQRGRGLFAARACAEIKSGNNDVALLVERIEVRIVIFKCYCGHLFRRHVVAVSVFTCVNAVSVQIVFIDEENPAAHARGKTFHDLHRCRWPRFFIRTPNRCACGALAKVRWCANEPSQRAGGYDCGRSQINERVTIAHAAFEIPIRGADCSLAFLHESLTESDARATTGRQRNCASTNQRLPVTTRSLRALVSQRSPAQDKIQRRRRRVRPGCE